jgi:hypothetical protein
MTHLDFENMPYYELDDYVRANPEDTVAAEAWSRRTSEQPPILVLAPGEPLTPEKLEWYQQEKQRRRTAQQPAS